MVAQLLPEVETLAGINAIVGRRRGPEAARLATLGMLCGSGLSISQLARTLPKLLSQIIALQSIGLFWSDPEGTMTDAYVDDPGLLSPDVFGAWREFRRQQPDSWLRFTEHVRQGRVAGQWLPYQNAEFYGSEHYALTYGKVGARHILDAVVHDEYVPLGVLALIRSESQGRFDDKEIRLASDLARLIEPAFAVPTPPSSTTRQFDGGLALIDSCNRVKFNNRAAYQSLWMMARLNGSGMEAPPNTSLDQLIALSCGTGIGKARNRGRYEEVIATYWGEFSLRYELVEGGEVAISIVQQIPFACQLAARLMETDLSVRRVMICWLMVCGLPRKDIAKRLGLGDDTVNEHIACIYASLNVRSPASLVSHFLT